jgi:hypothetical protein
MAKKKKKTNTQAQQKVQAAQHKKQYMERLRKLCTIIGNGESLFDLLPPYILRAIYDNRGVAPKIKVAKDAKITKRFVKIMYCHLENDLKNVQIDLLIPEIEYKVSLVDYYQVVLSLEGILSSPVCIFNKREKFDAFLSKSNERFDSYEERFTFLISYACLSYSDLSKRIMYTFTYDAYRPAIGADKYAGLFYQVITIGVCPLVLRYVAVHGESRPVVQVGEVIYTDEDVPTLRPITISLRRLHIKDPSGTKKIPVYVQQHAIDRILQRTCSSVPGGAVSLVSGAFVNKNKIVCEGEKYLVECGWGDVKIGYLVCMYIDNIFVVLTFLLITHSSTPEGRKLAKITGLKRDDLTFLAIDDLKTLVNSDITNDPRIIKIFVDAGCESILQINYDLHVNGYYEWLWDESKQDTELSKLIAEYIQLGDSDEEYFENEPG